MLDRPRSRRPRYFWPAAITLVVLAGLGLARINERAAEAVGYMEGIRQSSQSLVAPAASLVSLAKRVEEVDRAEFFTVTEATQDALAAAAAAVEEAPEDPPLLGVASLFRTAVATWSDGVTMFSTGVVELADGVPGGADRLYIGLQQVAAGDHLYLRLLDEIERVDIPDPVTPLPAIGFMPEGVGAGPLSRLYSVAATASNSLLALRADLAVASVMSDPEWVANTEGDLVIREAQAITIGVVVANNGNAPAPAQSIDVELVSPQGQELHNVAVPELAPGAQTTVSVPELAVIPGVTYQLQVRLVLTVSDADPTNNAQTFGFLVNEGSQ